MTAPRPVSSSPGLRIKATRGRESEEDLQQREDHWSIVDLVGKGRHIRTVPTPDWVHVELLGWLSSASINRGKIFHRISRTGRVLGERISEKALWHVVK